jgi:UDP-N-acetylglucosamine 2-epimerase (non-hydrolysing)
MKTVMSVFGTRPEAIKMAPVVNALNNQLGITGTVCVTGQHRGLLDQVLDLFKINPIHDLDVMTPAQNIWDVTTRVVNGLVHVFERFRPDMVLVHGDTSTSLGAALAAFYRKIPVGHVEAGLRTKNIYSPFPEEMNRKLVADIASIHFAPTKNAARNLLAEGVSADDIHVTGNTAIDALLAVVGMDKPQVGLAELIDDRPMVLITAHRRENFGEPLREIFTAIRDFAIDHPHMCFIYPVHPNPGVKQPAEEILGGLRNVHLLAPLGYEEMTYLMKQALFIMTDSGGIQEEAPSLGKPVLILRESTERPEVIEAGCASLVGSHRELIMGMMNELNQTGSETYRRMSRVKNPFGDGTAAERIAALVSARLSGPRFLPSPETQDVGIGPLVSIK